MKVFISWSGGLSNGVAKVLSEWLPTIINSLEIFYSQDDIEKGENWDTRLSNELAECGFGIICLTRENVVAPWINFEAGAISKELGAKVSAFLIDIKPSEIKGPIKRFQATRFEKDDFYKLVTGLNKCVEKPLESNILERSFNIVWEIIEKSIHDIIEKNNGVLVDEEKNNDTYGDAVQEILQIVRRLSNNTYMGDMNNIVDLIHRKKGMSSFEEKRELDIPRSRLIQVYNDAYRRILSELNSLYHVLEEEKNKGFSENIRSLHIETLENLSKRFSNITDMFEDEDIEMGITRLKQCKELLELED